MEVLLVLVPFVVVGLIVIFVAFSGGADAAREAYLTRGGRFFTLGDRRCSTSALGMAVPAAVIAARGEAEGGTGSLRSEEITGAGRGGQAALHPDLQELPHARGRPGPRRDRARTSTSSAGSTRQRVMQAIERGGTRLRPDAAGAPRGRRRRGRGPLRGRRSPVAEPPGAPRPVATPVAFSPQAPGFSVRRFRSAASMAASIEAEAPGENGAWGTQMAGRPGANRGARVAHLFQREPVS